MSSFLLSVRNKDSRNNEFGASIGVPFYLEVPDAENLPRPSHAVGMRAWLDKVAGRANPGGGGPARPLDVVFFVHGYNTPPKESLVRQRLVEQKLRERQYECVVVGFDWPTGGSALLYAYDRVEAQEAASQLVKGGVIPFTVYSAEKCPINVHVMAHSMGGFVVREAFRSVDKRRDAGLSNDWKVGQLVLFAADVSSASFELGNSDMQSVFAHCGRLTNYFSGHDEALAVSNVKNIDIDSRVGRVGMPVDTPAHEKAVDVDCGPRYAAVPQHVFKVIDGMESHSWYLEDDVWYDDLALTLKGQLDRNAFPTRTRVGENDFVLKT